MDYCSSESELSVDDGEYTDDDGPTHILPNKEVYASNANLNNADIDEEPQWHIRCLCGVERDTGGLMVQCDRCESWLHCSCVGLTRSTIPDYYVCPICHELDLRMPHHQESTQKNGNKGTKRKHEDDVTACTEGWCQLAHNIDTQPGAHSSIPMQQMNFDDCEDTIQQEEVGVDSQLSQPSADMQEWEEGAIIMEEPQEEEEESEEMKAERERFWVSLRNFLRARGQKLNKIPNLGSKPLDLFKLYKEVTARGGLQTVIENKAWPPIKQALGLPTTCTSAGYHLRVHYVNYLGEYEQTFYFKNNGLAHTANKKNGARNRKGDGLKRAEEIIVAPLVDVCTRNSASPNNHVVTDASALLSQIHTSATNNINTNTNTTHANSIPINVKNINSCFVNIKRNTNPTITSVHLSPATANTTRTILNNSHTIHSHKIESSRMEVIKFHHSPIRGISVKFEDLNAHTVNANTRPVSLVMNGGKPKPVEDIKIEPYFSSSSSNSSPSRSSSGSDTNQFNSACLNAVAATCNSKSSCDNSTPCVSNALHLNLCLQNSCEETSVHNISGSMLVSSFTREIVFPKLGCFNDHSDHSYPTNQPTLHQTTQEMSSHHHQHNHNNNANQNFNVELSVVRTCSKSKKSKKMCIVLDPSQTLVSQGVKNGDRIGVRWLL